LTSIIFASQKLQFVLDTTDSPPNTLKYKQGETKKIALLSKNIFCLNADGEKNCKLWRDWAAFSLTGRFDCGCQKNAIAPSCCACCCVDFFERACEFFKEK
jgi:hypothetical protein